MTARSFELIPFGAPAPAGAAACDGLVEGAAIDLSHWEGNATPAALKRDTSVEIALAFARSGETLERAVNNHFDTDGALAVYALVRSDVALAHEGLFVAAAEAGDFEEWPADERGLRLEAAVRRLGMLRTEADAYARVVDELEGVIRDLDRREDLWGSDWSALVRSEEAIARGDVAATLDEPHALATFVHARGVAELAGPVVHRASPGAKIRLFAFERDGGGWDYRVERARHAWADTVVRPRVAPPSKNALAKALAGALDVPASAWALKGELGMTGVLRTAAPIARTPADVAGALAAAIS